MYTYKASEPFWKHFHALPPEQKENARAAWELFKKDPFDPALGTHQINKLSSRHKTTVWAVRIEGDLRVVFKILGGNQVYTIDIGTHDVYR